MSIQIDTKRLELVFHQFDAVKLMHQFDGIKLSLIASQPFETELLHIYVKNQTLTTK